MLVIRLLVFSSLLIVSACQATEQARPLKLSSDDLTIVDQPIGFVNQITLDNIGQVYLLPSAKDYSISTPQYLVPKLDIQWHQEKLSIRCKSPCDVNAQTTIKIYLPEIKAITLRNGGDLKVMPGFGIEENLQLSLSNGGEVDTQNLAVATAQIQIRNGGLIKLNVSEKLSATVRNGGIILYQGEPEIYSDTKNGGDIRRVENANDLSIFRDPRDSQLYPTAVIGEATWLAKNLAYLPKACDAEDNDCGFWVYGQNDQTLDALQNSKQYKDFGVLYSWQQAQTACPNGWHLPDDQEWKALEVALGIPEGELESGVWRGQSAGDKARRGGSSGFDVRYGGWRTSFGQFNYIEQHANFWAADEKNSSHGLERLFGAGNPKIGRHTGLKACGFSVRCVKD